MSTTARPSSAYHPYGQYGSSEDGMAEPLASHYSSAPLLDIPQVPGMGNAHGWQSASMPTFGNLQRLSNSSQGTSVTGTVLTDEEPASDSDSQNSRDPFRLSTYARSSAEDVYLQARSGSEGRKVGRPIPRPISVQSIFTESREASIRAMSPYTDGHSIQTFKTAPGGTTSNSKRDSTSDFSTYSQSSSGESNDHDATATFHVGIEGQRAELTDQRLALRDPFRDSVISTRTGSSSETERATQEQIYSSHLLPRSGMREMSPREARGRTERSGSGLSYSSTGTSILDFQADYPAPSPTPR